MASEVLQAFNGIFDKCFDLGDAAVALEERPEFREKKYSVDSVKEAGLNYRNINHWESEGLLDNDRAQERQWRKFSLFDLAYILILKRLRDGLNFPIGKLLRTKASLYENFPRPLLDRQKFPEIPQLEFAVLSAMFGKEDGNAYLLIEFDGTAHFMTARDLTTMRERNGPLPEHILLCVNEVLKGLRLDSVPKISINRESARMLNNIESNIIRDINDSPEVESIQINKKNGMVVSIEKDMIIGDDVAVAVPFYEEVKKTRDGKVAFRKIRVRVNVKD